MKKLLLSPLLLIAGCLIAGAYGALHDQISYSVSTEYFSAFKFPLFGIPADYQNRLGAAAVGWIGAWWMGLVIGVPVLLIGLIVPVPRDYAWIFLQACLIVVGTTLIVGLGALGYGYLAYSVSNLPYWMYSVDVADPISFARVGTMHNFSYLGGLVGLLLACGYSLRAGLRLRRLAES